MPAGDQIYNGALRQRDRRGAAARDRQARSRRCREPPRRSIILMFVGGRGAGPARLAVLRGASDRSRRARSPRTSTTTAATSGARRATSRSSASASRRSTRSSTGVAAHAGTRRRRATSSRTAASSIARTSSTSPKIGVPAFYFGGGTDFIGRPDGWGAEQMNAIRTVTTTSRATSSRPTGTMRAWSQDARFGFFAGLLVANDHRLPPGIPAPSSKLRGARRSTPRLHASSCYARCCSSSSSWRWH